MTTLDVAGPGVGAGFFVLAMSFVREPRRRTLNAVIVAGASGVYLSGGFGIWELAYPILVTARNLPRLNSYGYIGVAGSCMPYGRSASLLGKPDLAFYGDVFLRVLRPGLAHRSVVLGGSTHPGAPRL